MDSCKDDNLGSSKSCIVTADGREAKTNRDVERNRIDEILRRLCDKKPFEKKKKKLNLPMKKSLRMRFERSNKNVKDDPSVSRYRMIPTNIDSPSQSCAKTRPCVNHSYNVYSYYYPKYDMSYGHCLYVTPRTLDVPSEDNALQVAPLAGLAFRQMRLLSLEHNWRMIRRKRRVNSGRWSFTFPTDSEWESTIYFFPRWDLSFCPLPMSRIQLPFGGVERAFPVETVIEEEEEVDSTKSEDLTHWKDIVESDDRDDRDTQHASCGTSTRTDLSSQSVSSNEMTSFTNALISRTHITQSPHSFCERAAIFSSPCMVEDIPLKSLRLKMREELKHLRMNQSELNDDIQSERYVETATLSNFGDAGVVERTDKFQQLEDLSSMHNVSKEESVSIVDKKKPSRKRSKAVRKTAMQKLVFVRPSVAAGISHQTKAGDIPNQRQTPSKDSGIDLPKQRNRDRKTSQVTARQTGKDWCQSCHIVDLFTQYDSPSTEKDIHYAPASRLRMPQDLRPERTCRYGKIEELGTLHPSNKILLFLRFFPNRASYELVNL